MFHKYAPELQDGDIWITPSGVPGVDINFSPLAKKRYPLACEAKNVEKINIWAALKQAEARKDQGIPVVIFKRNRTGMYICLSLDDFLRITAK